MPLRTAYALTSPKATASCLLFSEQWVTDCFCLTFSILLKQDTLCDVQYNVSCDNKVSVDCWKGRNIANIWDSKCKGLKSSGNGRKFSMTAASAD